MQEAAAQEKHLPVLWTSNPQSEGRRMNDYPPIMYRDSTVHFGPDGPTDKILERCQALATAASSAPYRVSLRFAFYRLWEQRPHYFADLVKKVEQGKVNFGEAKELAYERCAKTFSKAVHDGYYPADTFEDSHSSSQIATCGVYDNRLEWITGVIGNIGDDLLQSCSLDVRQDQERQVVLVFEAAAMWRQFEYYAKRYPVDLWSLGGQASNPHKYGLSQRIDELADTYPESTVTICYFGDCDYHGMQIPETALGDVESWTGAEFESYRIGVNTSPPGQWEAYDDKEAGEIITAALKHYLDVGKINALRQTESEATQDVNEVIEAHMDVSGLKSVLDDLKEEWESDDE